MITRNRIKILIRSRVNSEEEVAAVPQHNNEEEQDVIGDNEPAVMKMNNLYIIMGSLEGRTNSATSKERSRRGRPLAHNIVILPRLD